MPPSSSDESSEPSSKSAVRSASSTADEKDHEAEGLVGSRCMRAAGDVLELAANIVTPTNRDRLYCSDGGDVSTKYQA